MKKIHIIIFIWLGILSGLFWITTNQNLDRDVNQMDKILNQEKEITSTLQSINDLQKDLIVTGKTDIEQQIILNAIGDDYPPKKQLGQRNWCLNQSCVPAK